ncbi:unnamed protein product, partial [marine sediment metagenome]
MSGGGKAGNQNRPARLGSQVGSGPTPGQIGSQTDVGNNQVGTIVGGVNQAQGMLDQGLNSQVSPNLGRVPTVSDMVGFSQQIPQYNQALGNAASGQQGSYTQLPQQQPVPTQEQFAPGSYTGPPAPVVYPQLPPLAAVPTQEFGAYAPPPQVLPAPPPQVVNPAQPNQGSQAPTNEISQRVAETPAGQIERGFTDRVDAPQIHDIVGNPVIQNAQRQNDADAWLANTLGNGFGPQEGGSMNEFFGPHNQTLGKVQQIN